VTEDEFLRSAGEALRRARTTRGLTLREVAAASRGRFKSSVVGGYERGERSISLERFCELARFYEIPPDRLLAEALASLEPNTRSEIVLDLTKLSQVGDEDRRAVTEFVHRIRGQRSDYDADRLTLRAGDLEAIALSSHRSPGRVLSSLKPALHPARQRR